MSTATTTIGCNDLKPNHWYRALNEHNRYIIYPHPMFGGKPTMTLSTGQMFMFLDQVQGEEQWGRSWFHIGADDVFGFVNWAPQRMKFEEVLP